VTVNTSQSVPSTQVVSSAVAPAIPLPAQVVEDPLVGLSVPEEGVEAKAGKASAKDRVRKNVTLNFKLKGIALPDNSAEILFGHKTGVLLPNFLWPGKPLCRASY
jgi:hypothetical protein